MASSGIEAFMSNREISWSIALGSGMVRNDRTAVDQRVAFEIALGDQALREPGSENRHMDMRRPPIIDPVAPGIGARF